jgi:flavin-dependent dehydrogenase
MAETDYDCVVMGGGPAGATTATLLAQHGYRVALFERSAVPRFHIGESLMPETYWPLQRLGMIEKLKASAFPRKFSVQFVSDAGKESVPFYFFETNPHESSVTWQVWRADFDRMMLDNAREQGVEVHTATRVSEVLFDGEQAVGVRVARGAGATDCEVDDVASPAGTAPPARGGNGEPAAADSRAVRARVVVDATGQSSLIAHRLRLHQPDARLRKSSVWTYYRKARRDPGIDEGATLVLHVREKRGWFWYIPLPGDIVSVGVVGDLTYLLQGRGAPQQIFHEEVARCPAVAERLEPGQQFGPYYVTKDFSYHSTHGAGPGWVLVGDALGFLDPIYSSGVFLALKSGEWAADAVHAAIQKGDCSGEQLGAWIPVFLRGMEAIRKLVYAFYSPEFSFGAFIRKHPDQKKNLVDLLIGDVFKEGVTDIFTLMEPMLQKTV